MMIPIPIRTSVLTLQAQGHSLREISRLLGLSRNSVRRILRSPEPAPRSACPPPLAAALPKLFERAQGNVARIQQLLAAEHDLVVSYSTLTRWVREAQLRSPPRRSGQYHFEPGQEMQHDTSPHRLVIGGKRLTAQCAGLALAFSQRLFVQYFPRFTRFELKCFLLEAARFNDGTCPLCVIDNTSTVVVAGVGEQALFAPEMVAFARTLGFQFLAHRVGHPDRKARIERPFAYVEGNFLPARTFADFDDLNAQALAWCREVANVKPKRSLGMSPEAAYVLEKPHLQPLPALLPPVYELFERVVDLYGYVSVDTNRYSVPEKLIGQPVSAYKYPSEIHIYWRGSPVGIHPRLIGVRDTKSTLAGHHSRPRRAPRSPSLEQQLLLGEHELLDQYANVLKQRPQGTRALKRLLELKRTYPREPFLAAIARALAFGLFDLHRLEQMILEHVAGDFFELNQDHFDA
jgi:transposase